jgi:hypothetical protein
MHLSAYSSTRSTPQPLPQHASASCPLKHYAQWSFPWPPLLPTEAHCRSDTTLHQSPRRWAKCEGASSSLLSGNSFLAKTPQASRISTFPHFVMNSVVIAIFTDLSSPVSYSSFSLISEELHSLMHYPDLLFILVGGLRSRNRCRRLPPRPSHHGKPRPDHRAPFIHNTEFRGCDRTTSEIRDLSPKIISGDSRWSKNTQTQHI